MMQTRTKRPRQEFIFTEDDGKEIEHSPEKRESVVKGVEKDKDTSMIIDFAYLLCRK
jgi:hypothetical protein